MDFIQDEICQETVEHMPKDCLNCNCNHNNNNVNNAINKAVNQALED